MSVKQTVNIVTLVMVVFSLSGCLSLKKIDDKVLEQNQKYSDKFQADFGDEVKQKQDEVKDKAKETAFSVAEKTIKFIATTLTTAVKSEIDKWLQAKGFNQYGDPAGTMYTGGTPLFNETTGENKDKYEYILEKHPELIDELNLDN
jgi:hypothetical protein